MPRNLIGVPKEEKARVLALKQTHQVYRRNRRLEKQYAELEPDIMIMIPAMQLARMHKDIAHLAKLLVETLKRASA